MDRTLFGRVIGLMSATALAIGLVFGATLATLALLTAGVALGIALDRWPE